jgi:hypothetical protein
MFMGGAQIAKLNENVKRKPKVDSAVPRISKMAQSEPLKSLIKFF